MKSWTGWPHRTVCRTGSIGGWPPARVFGAHAVALSGPWLDLIVKVARDCRIGSQRPRATAVKPEDPRTAVPPRPRRSPSQASAQGFVPASAVGKRAEAREDMGQ